MATDVSLSVHSCIFLREHFLLNSREAEQIHEKHLQVQYDIYEGRLSISDLQLRINNNITHALFATINGVANPPVSEATKRQF